MCSLYPDNPGLDQGRGKPVSQYTWIGLKLLLRVISLKHTDLSEVMSCIHCIATHQIYTIQASIELQFRITNCILSIHNIKVNKRKVTPHVSCFDETLRIYLQNVDLLCMVARKASLQKGWNKFSLYSEPILRFIPVNHTHMSFGKYWEGEKFP